MSPGIDPASALNLHIEKERASIVKRALFLTGVSHDLGTPATRLLLRSEHIDDANLRSKMEADITKMTEMIEAVLAYTQSEINEEPQRPLSLISLVHAIVDDYQDLNKPVYYLEQKRTTRMISDIFQSKKRDRDELPLTQTESLVVRGQPLALLRAVTNLIDNALKYGRRATVSVTGSDTHAQIIIADNGQDMSVDEIENLIHPFQRGNNSQNTVGTGIGLTIVSNIAEQHGGSLKFEKTPDGLAAIFTILR